MTTHFADRLTEACRAKKTALCVGLDPRYESLPAEIRRRHTPERKALAYEEFCLRVLEIVAPLVALVKPQVAFFEACGAEGYVVLERLMNRSRQLGLLTILDAKRNDIASTATAYAEAAFEVWKADALTINPYLGQDAIDPFVQTARKNGAGVFVLVRTSNPGAGLFQDLSVSSEGETLYARVGQVVAAKSRESLGRCGLGDVGAVVGATYPSEAAALRKVMPEVIFLVPGFGAQGGTAADVRPSFREDRSGAIVNSSRGILFPGPADASDWESRIEKATRDAIANLNEAGC
jgi:orotidine-5'-phosphate decarboxylase